MRVITSVVRERDPHRVLGGVRKLAGLGVKDASGFGEYPGSFCFADSCAVSAA